MIARPAIAAIVGRLARILIVDDDRDNRELLAILLTHDGFVVATAAGGAEALAAATQQPPDLILLDILLPDMNGYQVAAKLKGDAATRDIPIIMLSALDGRDARDLALGAGAVDFFSKPMDSAELRARLSTHLRPRGTVAG